VAEPLLDIGNVGLVRKGVSCGRCPQRVDAKAVHLAVDAGFEAVITHDVAIDRSRIERPIQLFRGAVIFNGPEQRPADVPVTCLR
jgi:hypothetical protein